ncbi:MAG: hypothetical protein H7X97_02505 [Opitutaceae bacterium]|nr:hypothetical protein [Verrucomicrobiales bacterium]
MCHNQTSTKAGLNLETPQSMLKGGDSGPAIKPRNGGKSLLIQAAAHLTDAPMPPKGNKASAIDLTPEQIGLVKLWIDQGAKTSNPSARAIEWQALPPGLNPIHAVALTQDGQFAACGRANQIFVYHIPTGQLVTRLTDPALIKSGLYAQHGVAHRDLVESLAFSPDGTRLASGSYREVKLWQRAPNARMLTLKNAVSKTSPIMAASADGNWLATGDGGKIKLWSIPSGKAVKTLAVLKGVANHLKFSPNSARLAVASSNSLAIWTVADGKCFAQHTMTNAVFSLAWLADGRHLAAGGADNLIRIWKLPEAANGELVLAQELKGHTGPVMALENPGAVTNQILSGSTDGLIRVWDVTKGEVIRQITNGAPVLAVAVRGDGKRYASAGANGAAKLWDATDGKMIAELKGNLYTNQFAAERERSLILATNEVIFRRAAVKSAETNLTAMLERVKSATATNEAVARQFEAAQKSFKDTDEAKLATEKAVEEFAPVKKAAEVYETADKAAKQADAAAKEAQGKPDKISAEKLVSEAAEKAKVAAEAKVLADKLTAEVGGKRKAAEDKLAAAVKAFGETEKNFKKAESAKAQSEHELQLASSAKTFGERTLDETKSATAASESRLKRAEADWQTAMKAAADVERPIRALAFSADNRWLATGGEDRLAHTWSADSGAAGDVFSGHVGMVGSVAFGNTGLLISAAADRSVVLWHTTPVWRLERGLGSGDAVSPLIDRVAAVRFSPDGQLLATGGGEPSRSGEIKLWQVATGKAVQTLTNIHSDTVLSLDFSRDGKLLASGGADKFAKVTDLATGRIVKSLEGHSHHVLGVAWKSDGRTLATAGADGVVKIWDFLTGERRKNIEGFAKEVTSVQFVGVTDQALTSSGDGKVRLVRDNGSDVRGFSGFSDFVYATAATPDGSVVVAGGQDGVLRVWNGTNGQITATFAPPAMNSEQVQAASK